MMKVYPTDEDRLASWRKRALAAEKALAALSPTPATLDAGALRRIREYLGEVGPIYTTAEFDRLVNATSQASAVEAVEKWQAEWSRQQREHIAAQPLQATPQASAVVYHSLERTSPKGRPFLGTCRLCGRQNLPPSAVSEPCPNQRGLSADEALVEAVTPQASAETQR